MMTYQGNKDIYKVTKDNVEDYANKFLLFFCKDAIFNPQKINIEKIIIIIMNIIMIIKEHVLERK